MKWCLLKRLTYFLFFISFISLVYADQTVKTVEIPLGFVKNMPAGYLAEKDISFNPSDGIEQMLYGQLILKGDFPASTVISSFIGDSELECSPSKITTPVVDVYNYEAPFDCSDKVIGYKGGNVIVKFNFTNQVKNVDGKLKITYYNNPDYSLSIHGTEYTADQIGKVFIQVLDDNKLPVENLSCFASVYYPDGTNFIDQAIMSAIKVDGIYYKDVVLDEYKIGVHMSSAFCYVPEVGENTTTEITVAYDSFESGDGTGGTGWGNDWVFDDTDASVVSTGTPYNGTWHLRVQEWTTGARDINLSGQNSSDIWVSFWFKIVRLDGSETGKFWINDGSQEVLRTWIDGEDDNIYRYYEFSLEGYDMENFENLGFTIDGSGNNDVFYVDNLKIFTRVFDFGVINISEYQYVRGSGELHVSELSNLSLSIDFTLDSEERHSYIINRISGTEVFIGEPANIVVQVLQNGVPDKGSTCTISIYSPNGSYSSEYIKVVTDASMSYIEGSSGMYKYNFDDTNYSGLYITDTICSDRGIGIIPMEHINNITESTTSTTLINITNAEINLTVGQNAPIVAVMSIDGWTDGAATGTWGIQISDKIVEIDRGFGGTDQSGNMFVVSLNENITSGNHTITGMHKTSTGTLNSRVNLAAFALEDGTGVMDYCYFYNESLNATVTGLVLQDMDVIECTIQSIQDSEFFIVLSFTGETSINDKYIRFTVSIDGVDLDSIDRQFDNAGVPGALSYIISTDEIEQGTHIFKARWGISGGEGTASHVQLMAISNVVGARKLQMATDTLSTGNVNDETPQDIGVGVPITIYGESHVIGFLSMESYSSAANKNGYYLVDIDGTDGTTFRRYYSNPNVEGSISIVESLHFHSPGLYDIKGEWFTDGSNTITGNGIKMIGLGFSTATEFAPVYQGLDFHVYNRSEFARTIWSDENRSLTDYHEQSIWEYYSRNLTYYPTISINVSGINVSVDVNNTAIAEAVWEYEGTIVTNIVEQIAQAVWEFAGGVAEIIS